MKSEPILDEIHRVKDELAQESGYDARVFFSRLRQWVAENPHQGPVIEGAEGLRKMADAEDRQRIQAQELQLNDKPKSPPTQCES